MADHPPRNLGLDLVRVTEAAALEAGRWMGLGKPYEADQQAGQAMHQALNTLDMEGRIVVGERIKAGGSSPLSSGRRVGTGHGPEMDVVADAIEGRNLLVQGHPDAISVVGVAPRGSMWAPDPALYMDKIVVDREAAAALVPECIGAPTAWTLALVARVKDKPIRDLVVFVLNRPRHEYLIEEIRAAGARAMLRSDGDIAGALMAAMPEIGVDLLMGVGGVSEGVISACAVKALGGGMLGCLAPQSEEEQVAVEEAGLDCADVADCDHLVSSDEIFFAATGITNGTVLRGVSYRGDTASTESLVLRSQTGTRRFIRAEHRLPG